MKTVTKTTYQTTNQCSQSTINQKHKTSLKIKVPQKKQNQLVSACSRRRQKRKSCSWNKKDNGSNGLKTRGDSVKVVKTQKIRNWTPIRDKKRRLRSCKVKKRSMISKTM